MIATYKSTSYNAIVKSPHYLRLDGKRVMSDNIPHTISVFALSPPKNSSQGLFNWYFVLEYRLSREKIYKENCSLSTAYAHLKLC